VKEVREDDARGRHTTTRRRSTSSRTAASSWTRRDAPSSPSGTRRALGEVFSDIDALVPRCGFSNCSHNGEPGCALAAALADGSLASERLASWRSSSARRPPTSAGSTPLARAEDRRKWKAIGQVGDRST